MTIHPKELVVVSLSGSWAQRGCRTVSGPQGALCVRPLSWAVNGLDALGDAALSDRPWKAMLSVTITDSELCCV